MMSGSLDCASQLFLSTKMALKIHKAWRDTQLLKLGDTPFSAKREEEGLWDWILSVLTRWDQEMTTWVLSAPHQDWIQFDHVGRQWAGKLETQTGTIKPGN